MRREQTNSLSIRVVERSGAEPAPLQHRVILADGHVAVVEIAERTFDLLPLQLFRDQPPDVPRS
jgi:hypothetical protein